MSTHNQLEQAISHTDLPGLVSDLYPKSGARPGSKHRAKAVWRGGDGQSVAFWRRGDEWLMTDHGAGETYSAYTFLTDVAGYSKQQAVLYLLSETGTSSAPVAKHKPVQHAPAPTTVTTAKADVQRWQRAAKTGTSAYLTRKGITGVSCAALRYDGSQVGVLMSRVTATGVLEPTSVQWIYSSGFKKFAEGGTTRGTLALVGADNLANLQGRVYICEGYATACTVHMATSKPVVVAFTANNLEHVVRTLKQHCKTADIVLAADNDAYHTAAKGNPGLEKAHKTALTYRVQVCSPAFTDTSSKPTDYNDLMMLEGLGAVSNQLTPQQPSAVLAFADDYRKLHKKLKRQGATRGRYLPVLDELPTGVTLIKSPQGTGKTHAMRELIAGYEQQGLRVLYLTHRVSLARDAARRLHLHNYDDLDGRYIRDVSSLAVCVNSLHRLLDEYGKLTPFDVVIVDESEQFVSTLRGKHIEHKRDNLAALQALIQRASRLICLDADLGVLTHRLLQHYRPRERYHYKTHHHEVGKGRCLQVHSSRESVYQKLVSLEQPVVIATNSKRESERVHALLASEGKQGRLINSSTASGERDFLADIDSQCSGLDYLVYSPSVNTGVSLESGHFKHVVGLFTSSVGTPEDALQALWRVRTSVTYDVWLDPRNPSDAVDIQAKYGTLAEHERALLNRELPLKDNAAYEDIKQAADSLEQHKRAAYRVNTLKLAVLQGFDVSFMPDVEGQGLVKRAKELADKAYNDAVEHSEQHSETRAGIRDFYKLTEDDCLRHWIELDDRGNYRRRVVQLEAALADDDHLDKLLKKLLERTEMQADMPAVASAREFHCKLLEAVSFVDAAKLATGSKLEQTALPRYSKDSLEAFVRWVEANRAWLAGLVALPKDPDKLRANPLRYVGGWLKRLGLKQTRVGKNDQGTYSLELVSLTYACRTLQKRGTLLLDDSPLDKSVPTSNAVPEPPKTSPPDWLQGLQSALARGAFSAIGNLELLTQFTRQALTGDSVALAALEQYIQHPQVAAVLA